MNFEDIINRREYADLLDACVRARAVLQHFMNIQETGVYDWNADPLALTLLTSTAIEKLQAAINAERSSVIPDLRDQCKAALEFVNELLDGNQNEQKNLCGTHGCLQMKAEGLRTAIKQSGGE